MKVCSACRVILIESEKKCPSCGMLLIQDADESVAAVGVLQDIPAASIFPEKNEVFVPVPVSKQVIISPAFNTSEVGARQYVWLILICLVPLLNLIVVPYLAFNHKTDKRIKNAARYALIAIGIASIILIMILAKFNFKTLFISLRDYIMVVIRGISGR